MKRHSPPVPDREAPDEVSAELLSDLEEALIERHGERLLEDERLSIDAASGPDAAWLKLRVGSEERGHEGELFVRGVPGPLLDGALGVLVDYADGLLEEWLTTDRDAWLPLDWDARTFDAYTVFARGDVRDYAAERAADRLLSGNGHSPER